MKGCLVRTGYLKCLDKLGIEFSLSFPDGSGDPSLKLLQIKKGLMIDILVPPPAYSIMPVGKKMSRMESQASIEVTRTR